MIRLLSLFSAAWLTFSRRPPSPQLVLARLETSPGPSNSTGASRWLISTVVWRWSGLAIMPRQTLSQPCLDPRNNCRISRRCRHLQPHPLPVTRRIARRIASVGLRFRCEMMLVTHVLPPGPPRPAAWRGSARCTHPLSAPFSFSRRRTAKSLSRARTRSPAASL